MASKKRKNGINNFNLNKCIVLFSKNNCFYCGRAFDNCIGRTRDHFYPKSKGGKLMVYSCPDCNTMKKDMTPLQFCDFLERIKLERIQMGFPEYSKNFDCMIGRVMYLWDKVKWSVKYLRDVRPIIRNINNKIDAQSPGSKKIGVKQSVRSQFLKLIQKNRDEANRYAELNDFLKQ